MRWYALLVVLLTTACSPLEPTLPPTSPNVLPGLPASLTLTLSGPTSASESLVSLRVTDATGVGVPTETIFLSTTAGTVPASVVTGPTGAAQVMLRTTEDATVTAKVRDLIGTIAAAAFRLPEPPEFHDPPPPPPPPPPVGPPPVVTPPPSGYVVTLHCTPRSAGAATPCNVNVSYNDVVLASVNVSNVDWDWGDGVPTTTALPATSHIYAGAGQYTVFATVTATTSAGAKTATVSMPLTIP